MEFTAYFFSKDVILFKRGIKRNAKIETKLGALKSFKSTSK